MGQTDQDPRPARAACAGEVRMNLRPLGSRVLIRPIPNETTTESGLVLMEHRKPETMGEVVAVGAGSCCSQCEVFRQVEFVVGDTVIFPWTAGREVSLDDGPPYLMMNESDILAILET
jgi:chaperonin GroES